jgi:hypothetical protein
MTPKIGHCPADLQELAQGLKVGGHVEDVRPLRRMNGSQERLARNQVIKDLIRPVSDARDRRSPISLQVQQLKCHLGVCRVIAQLSELRIDVPSWPDVIPFVQERAKQRQIGRVNRRALRVRLQLSDPVNSHWRQVSLPTRGMTVDAWISGAPLA